jgi:putative SOS response-associated peptidase YedK
MCGRYAVTLPPEAMMALFKVLGSLDYPPRYNIAPTQPIVTILEEHGRRVAKLMRWGLVPGWVKDPREFPLVINARVESMCDKPAFRDALKHQRCIVPASGYFEWHTGPDKRKQPYFITLADGQPMAFAGLYSTWMGPQGEEIDTAATITVPANPDLSHIHDRMPAILQGEAIEQWLDVRHVRAGEASALAQPLPPGVVAFHPVSSKVGSSDADGADLLAAIRLEDVQVVEKKKAAASRQLDLF